MKDRLIKIILVIFIIVHIALPVLKFAMSGYPDLFALLSEIYKNGVLVVLSAAVLRLYNKKDK